MEEFEWIGSTPVLQLAQTQIREAASTDLSVLIVGEPGTGRHLAARTLHVLGQRCTRPFVRVHCGALHPEQAAELLFSHPRASAEEAGPSAPSRASIQPIPAPSARLRVPRESTARVHRNVSRPEGALVQAEGGTLFLDEVEALPSTVQRQLLVHIPRPSQGPEQRDAEPRIVASTSIDLGRAARNGAFNADLYYRLAIVTVQLDPLRERLDDLPELATGFIRELGIRAHSREHPVSREVLGVLAGYDWPGNVWELKSLFRRAAVLDGDQPLTAERIRQLITEASWMEEPAGQPVTRSGSTWSRYAGPN